MSVVLHVAHRRRLLLPILAISWFWLFGATIVSGLPTLAKDVLFADEQVVTLMLALFAVGVGIGSMLAERLLHGDVSARATCRWRPSCMAVLRDRPARGERRPRATAALTGVDCVHRRSQHAGASSPTWSAWRPRGGLFCVPLYAVLQHESEPAHRARVIAANNIINAIAMTVAAVGAAALLAQGVSIGQSVRPVRHRDDHDRRRRGVDPAPRHHEDHRCASFCALLYRVEVEGLEHVRAALCRTRSSPPTMRRSSTACCSARSCRATRSSRSIR